MSNLNYYTNDFEYDFNLKVAESRLKLFKSSIKKILNLTIEDSAKVSAIISNLESGYYKIPTIINNDENIRNMQHQLLNAHKNLIFILKSDFSPDKKLSSIKIIIGRV
jgi:hypothetical protein